MSSPTGFLAAFLALALAPVIGMVGVNVIVDPYWRFDVVSIEGLNAQRPAANSRLGKAGALCRIQPRQAVFGTSRVDVGIDPRHPRFRDLPGPIYNAALAGSGLHELAVTLRHAVNASPGLERLLIGLDFMMFNAHREVAAYGTEVLDYDEGRLLLSKHDTCLRALLYDASRLLGMAGLLAAYDTVVRQIREPELGADNSHVMAWVALLDDSGFRRNFSSLAKTLVPVRGYRGLFGIAQERYYAAKVWRPPPSGRYCFAREGRPDTIEVFRDLVRFARASHRDARFFINPVHARMLIALREAGLWPQYEEWKRALVRVLADEAGESGKSQLPLWDFSGFNSVTMEPIPPEGDTTTVLNWFWEPSHYKAETGNLMLDRILGYREPGRRLPDDFGIALTPDTIEPWIEATRKGVETYAQREPQEIAVVKAVVDEVMADAEGANCGEDAMAAREGAAMVARGDKAGADASFARAVRLHEEDRRRYAALGAPYRERGFDQVMADARRGLGGEPQLGSWIDYQTRGMKRSKAGDHLGAAADFDKAIRMGPPNTALHFLKGTALLAGGVFAEAAGEFERGLKLEPENKTLQSLLRQSSAAAAAH
jgi:hypothetical protein